MNIKKILRRSPTPEEIKETLLEQALDEAASKTRLRDTHKAIADTYGEFRDIARRYPNLGAEMTDVSNRFRDASKVLGGDWQWMLQDARYKNNPLVAQAVSEIIQRDGLKGLKKDTVSELQRRLDVRTDLKNEKAIRQNRLQKELDQYQDLDDIVAKKFAHNEDTDVAAELMGMNPDTGASMPDNLKQAMEAIALNRGVPVVNGIDDVLNNPFVDEAVKNNRLMAYENRKIPGLTKRQDAINQSEIRDARKNYDFYDKDFSPGREGRFAMDYKKRKGLGYSKDSLRKKEDYLDRNQGIATGNFVESRDIYGRAKRTEERIKNLTENLTEEQAYIDEQMKLPWAARDEYQLAAAQNDVKQFKEELADLKEKRDFIEEAAKKDMTMADLGDSDVESVFDQFKDDRQLEWEKPQPRFEAENALREAEYYKDPVKPTIEQRRKELIAQASKTNPKRMVPYTKYSRRGSAMDESKINELDILRSMYPKLKRLSPEEVDLIARSVFSERKR